MEHSVAVPHQRNAESSANELAGLADSFEGRSATGRREWFRMSVEDAQAILNQIGTPLEDDDYRLFRTSSIDSAMRCANKGGTALPTKRY
jgi:hypothetical protein